MSDVVTLINTERETVGVSPLAAGQLLKGAAQAHSDDMAAKGRLGHDGSDGSTPERRATAAGYHWTTLGECVAWGYATPEAAVAGWMGDKPHRDILLDPAYKDVGVAVTNSYWTADFGAELPAPAPPTPDPTPAPPPPAPVKKRPWWWPW